MTDAKYPAVFFANGYGDTILNLPALRALFTIFPGRLTLICSESAYHLCLSELPARKVVMADMKWGPDGRHFDASSLAAAVGECDLFLSLVPWRSRPFLQLMNELSPKDSIGFFDNFGIRLPLDYTIHSADLAFSLPRYFQPSLQLEQFASPPIFPAKASQKARSLLEMAPSSMRVLTLHADTLPEKMWAPEKFVSLADSFLTQHPDFVIFAVGSSPQHFENGKFADWIIPCYGLSLPVSMSLVEQADLFLGVDSCMLHVADFCRVPGVGLFGPTRSEEFGFRLAPHRHVSNSKGMAFITEKEALAALEALVAEVGTPV